MGRVTFHATPLGGLYEIVQASVADARGRFLRLFCEQDFAPIRAGLHFTQINLSETKQAGIVRGMHYQTAPVAEAKLIRCLRGRVFDVAVDIRADSPTFLQWHGAELRADGPALFIPEGFAHGFQALSNDVQMLYMHTAAWAPGSEGGIRHDDPWLGIDWPLPPTLVSQKDHGFPLIDGSFIGVRT